jgi:hypothetical protein
MAAPTRELLSRHENVWKNSGTPVPERAGLSSYADRVYVCRKKGRVGSRMVRLSPSLHGILARLNGM